VKANFLPAEYISPHEAVENARILANLSITADAPPEFVPLIASDISFSEEIEYLDISPDCNFSPGTFFVENQ
jgi:hypothetical protein